MTAYLLHHESASKCRNSELKLESVGVGKPIIFIKRRRVIYI